MKGPIAPAALLLLLSAASSPALQVEVGAIAGAGPCFAAGSYLDAKAADLAEQGAVGVVPGRSEPQLFPGMSAGAYGQVALLPWLALRLELRASYLGASLLALTADGVPFDAYGAGFYALMLPVLARGSFALGPGSLSISLGGFYGLAVGGMHIQDAYAVTTTSSVVPLTTAQASMIGVSGGAGYGAALGPGTASVEVRVDWSLYPVRLDGGLGSGDLAPLHALIIVGYGVSLEKGNR